jgi:CubicO group peptidase (beta-lactamase class C family)
MLAESGQLEIDNSIRRYFPDAPKSWQEITVCNLLSHTSGLGDYTADFDLRKDYSEDELCQIIFRQKLEFLPGNAFRYSNLGYVILGALVSKVSGKLYGDFLNERIFGPLGMTNSCIINESKIIPNRASGYWWDKDKMMWRNQEWVSPTFNSTGDGALYLTVDDVVKWDSALYTNKLVSKSMLDFAFSGIKLNNGTISKYNCGWFFTEINNHRLFEHDGAWQGFMAIISRYVDDDLAVVIFANLIGAPVGEIAHFVAGLWDSTLASPLKRVIEL